MSPAASLEAPAGLDVVLDGLARCAADIAGCPMGLVVVAQDEHLAFAGRHGPAFQDAPLAQALLRRALGSPGLFELRDAHAHPRQGPARSTAAAPPGLRFFAGLPLTVHGAATGALFLLTRQQA